MPWAGLPKCRPEEVGLDSELLQKHVESNRWQVDTRLQAGVAECVIKDNKVVYVDTQGYQDAERKTKMSTRSLQRCYSITKPITAFGLLMLWEEGKLKLDDPVSKYIPEFAKMKVLGRRKPGSEERTLKDATRPITLRNLVTHTSGLGYGPVRHDRSKKLPSSKNPIKKQYRDFVRRADSGEIPNLEAYCKEIAKQPLQFEPGESYEYSFSMEVVGRVLEVVSGMPLNRFLKERVFDPIGMRDTDFFISPRKARRQLAGLYLAYKDKRKQKHPRKHYHLVRTDGCRPEKSGWVHGQTAQIFAGGGFVGSCDGGLVASLRDLALFCNTIANEGFSHATGMQVLSPATVKVGCKNWLKLKSVTSHYPKLKGWYDPKSNEQIGWAPFGITDGDFIFMGGIGYWSVNRRNKTVVVSLPNTSWEDFDKVPGWNEEVDEIEEATKKAAQRYKEKLRQDPALRKRWRSAMHNSKPLLSVMKRRRTT
jgi:CubicO group peptidase (beta-lactamase class C family)